VFEVLCCNAYVAEQFSRAFLDIVWKMLCWNDLQANKFSRAFLDIVQNCSAAMLSWQGSLVEHSLISIKMLCWKAVLASTL
jgi:hypothetical protein